MLPVVAATLMTFISTVMMTWSQTMLVLFTRMRLGRQERLRIHLRKRRRNRQAKRRFLMQLIALLSKPRRMRGEPGNRNGSWWHDTVPLMTDEEWVANFRMRKATFNWICSQLYDHLKPQPNCVIEGHALTVERIVAIAIYKLAHVAEYRVVGNLFGVSKSSVHNCVYAFCYALVDVKAKDLIQFPNSEEAKSLAERFQRVTNIPQIIGAIDGSHIPLTPPKDGSADFVNRKFYHSMVLQAIVDIDYIFRDISCMLPGSCHDIDVFHESHFFKNHQDIMPKGVMDLDGLKIPYLLLGDPAYPLMPWLLKNYRFDRNITPIMDSFNVYLNKGRVVVENAFGRLKGRWRIVGRKSDIHYMFIPTLVGACCVLHNICEMSKEDYNPAWTRTRDGEDGVTYPECDNEEYDVENRLDGEDIRDHLMLNLSERVPTLSSIRGRIAMEQ